MLFGLWLASAAVAGQNNGTAVTPPLEQPVSGYRFLTPETRALQDDAFANPGYLWVAAGAEAYQKTHGTGSCKSCHGEKGMVGVAARYPRYDGEAQSLLNLEGRINACRTEHQKLPALAYESQELLALTSFVAEQSRGMMTQVSISGGAEPWFQAGEDYFFQRRGQLNLACHQCHDQSWGECCGVIGLAKASLMPSLPIDWSGSRWALCIDDCKTARLGSEPNLKPWALAPISGWNSTWCGVREVWLWNHPGCADKTEKGKVRGLPR